MPRSVTIPAVASSERALGYGIRGSAQYAAYAILSQNTSTPVVGGAAFFDQRLGTPSAWQAGNSATVSGAEGVIFDVASGTFLNYSQFFACRDTSAQVSSTATTNLINGTCSTGEFGSGPIDFMTDGAITKSRDMQGNGGKWAMNALHVNSNHLDKTTVYLLQGTQLYAVDRLTGQLGFSKTRTRPFTITGVNAATYGAASYNRRRREFVVLSNTSAANFTLSVFSGVDLDANPSPFAAFNASGVTRVDTAITFPSWSNSTVESLGALKPVLCDDGRIFVGVVFVSSNYAIYQIARNSTTGAVTGTTFQTSQTLHTASYGADQDWRYYGQRAMNSWDTEGVLLFCNFAQYNCGLRSWIVDRINNTFVAGPTNADTTNGVIPAPFGKTGFTAWYAGNYYASNFTGGFIVSSFERNLANRAFGQSMVQTFLANSPAPNTTNYPGFSHASDFALLPEIAFSA